MPALPSCARNHIKRAVDGRKAIQYSRTGMALALHCKKACGMSATISLALARPQEVLAGPIDGVFGPATGRR
jgi:hypothetical protein